MVTMTYNDYLLDEGKMEHCKLCDEATDNLVKQVETSVLDMIKKHHPDWVETDGSCKKCVAYYENLDQLIIQED